MDKETIWVDSHPEFTIDGNGVLFLRTKAPNHIRMSHASFRNMLERGIRELNAFEDASRGRVLEFKRGR